MLKKVNWEFSFGTPRFGDCLPMFFFVQYFRMMNSARKSLKSTILFNLNISKILKTIPEMTASKNLTGFPQIQKILG